MADAIEGWIPGVAGTPAWAAARDSMRAAAEAAEAAAARTRRPSTFYDTLGVAPTATRAEVARAVRRARTALHPDVALAAVTPLPLRSTDNMEHMRDVVDYAADILGCEARRAAYDALCRDRALPDHGWAHMDFATFTELLRAHDPGTFAAPTADGDDDGDGDDA